MYQVSRAIYRELSRDIAGGREEHEAVLRSCEAAIARLVADNHYFARPARALFRDLRPHFDRADWPRVWQVVHGYVAATQEVIARMPRTGVDAAGNRLQCRATTRRGTACQRVPLHSNGYCPSHQHLAETEEIELRPTAEAIAA
ncbi:MAG: hypothetical protein QOH46_902 [Solirubrobacteraceae bacterium]|jgi:hypothetical protein|nr:hypothetical protein [Solirubrobacteraceae bacterium]